MLKKIIEFDAERCKWLLPRFLLVRRWCFCEVEYL